MQSITTSSVNVTGITISWDRVDCQERNGHTGGYRLIYYPTSNPSDFVARILAGTDNTDRLFSISGLPPRTGYTFGLQAVNPNLDVRGPPAFYTVNTSAPQGI